MSRAGMIAALAVAASAVAGCQPRTPPQGPLAAHFTAATDLQAIPLGPPPGDPISVAKTIRNPFEGDAGAIAHGQQLFGSMNCVYCHGDGGGGLIGPPLNNRGWRYGGTPAQIYNSIHDGRPKGMPAWGSKLPPDEIWRLVAYIESLGGAEPPATQGMTTAAGPGRPTASPDVAGQSETDSAAAARKAGNEAPPPQNAMAPGVP